MVNPLARLMIAFARKFLDMKNIDLILSVPLHSQKLRQRQFNQAQLLVEPLAGAFSKKMHTKLISKIEPGPAQVELSRTERLKMVRDTFKIRKAQPLKDKNILLVDDVFTTGATANECAKALLASGAKKVEVFTLARGV